MPIKENNQKALTYISLFSSAGIGCYGFKLEGFECVATCELLAKRLAIQRYNNKCRYETGYICGDMTTEETKLLIDKEMSRWHKLHHVTDLDVLIATPPCQGMSYANHKKNDKEKEMKRNSLVVESITMTKRLRPKFFVYENVRAFLGTACLDIDGNYKSIKDAIAQNLGGNYNISYNVINFKDYGCPSSRTRTLVVGVRKDILDFSPSEIMPELEPEKMLREVIGHLPSLTEMGEISTTDIYHGFRSYNPIMLPWIENLEPGQGAFDNPDPERRPYHLVDGIRIPNAEKNGDKYTRQRWDKVAPCIHTRNDILASQNTVHPCDNRVFSIREVMLMMSVPESFEWSETPFVVLNKLPLEEKKKYLSKNDSNIRTNLGEAVPTIIFQKIAKKIRLLLTKTLTDKEVDEIIKDGQLGEVEKLITFIQENRELGFVNLSKIAEYANALREDNEAFYTRANICHSVVKYFPKAENFNSLSILEPSVGVGNFLPSLIDRYRTVPNVKIDVCDIDVNSIRILKELVSLLDIPQNIHIRYLNEDSLLYDYGQRYDIVVGNPPYKKMTGKAKLLSQYKANMKNKETNNLFSFFIEKAVSLGDFVSLIVPKSLINAPEFNLTRKLICENCITNIIDFGEKAFKGVKIETIAFGINTLALPNITTIESYITDTVKSYSQSYIVDENYPYWLIYRNESFDKVAGKMVFGIFKAFRDRSITKTVTKEQGRYRVLKSRNVASNNILDIPGYDCYMDNIEGLLVAEFLDKEECFLVPNLTYYPRACRLPKGCIADGSVAILQLKEKDISITEEDLAYYATEEFTEFYKIARNRGTRSLNIDNNSVFFFGKLK